MNGSTSRIVAAACALLLVQLATGSAEAQQESSAVREVRKPVLPGPVSHGAALSEVSGESFAGRQHEPVTKTPGHGAGSGAGAPGCGDGTCDSREDACTCPDDCPDVCPCVLFDNEADFVAFTEGQGSTLNALETFEDMSAQITGMGVDLKRNHFIMGPKITYDNAAEHFTGEYSGEANALIKLTGRPGFEIPAVDV